MSWRDVRGSELLPADEGREVTLAGWVATRRDHGGLIFVDLRDEGGLVQVVINPANAPAAAKTAHDLRNEFVIQARGTVVRRTPETVNPAMATGEIEVQTTELQILSRSTPLPFQLDEEGVDETLRHPLPLARPAARADAAQHQGAGEARLDHPLRDGGRGLRRHRDADHGEADAGGRARLPGPDAPPARPLLRAAPEPADLQAAARHLRLRALLPDRPLLSGRGSRAPTGSRS